MFGKEPPSDLPRCCSLLSPCYPGRELLAAPASHQELCWALAQPQWVLSVPAAEQLWRLGDSPASPSTLGVGSTGKGCEKIQGQPTSCESSTSEQEQLCPPAVLQETLPRLHQSLAEQQNHLADKNHQAQQQSSWESLAAGSLSFTWSSLHSCELSRPCFIS